MPHAVRFDRYGGIDVLQVVQVEHPVPGPGQVLVKVKAADVNPGEAAIRQGAMAQRWPMARESRSAYEKFLVGV